MSTHVLELHFGALSPPLAEQLAEFEIDTKTLEHWQKDLDAILRLAIRGLITEAEKKRAMNRLWKAIWKVVQKAPHRQAEAVEPISSAEPTLCGIGDIPTGPTTPGNASVQ